VAARLAFRVVLDQLSGAGRIVGDRPTCCLALSGLLLIGAGVGCAASNRASGTLAGKSFDGRVLDGKYCAHCGGGVQVSVAFKPPNARPEDWTLVLETEACIDGYEERVGALGGSRVYRWRERPAPTTFVSAVEGEIDVHRCSEKWLKASFWARFEDGSRVSGDVSTALTYDAGYE
jgi:hypothetical protein